MFDLVFVVGVAAGLALALVGLGRGGGLCMCIGLRDRFRRFCGCFLTQFLRGLA